MKKTFFTYALMTAMALFLIAPIATFNLSAANQPVPIGSPTSPDTTNVARVQVIHNSADAAAAEVDVWLNNTKLLPNFAFRTASPFVDAPAGVPLNIVIAPPNSTSPAQGIDSFQVTLAQNEKYVVVANGIVSPTGYSPAPAFNLDIFPLGRESASQQGNTDVLVVHGSTDAPMVKVVTPGAAGVTLIDSFAYGNFSHDYLELPTADYTLNITDITGSQVVASYKAPLQTLLLEGAAIVVVASGFLDPTNNSNSANDFGLWVALPTGMSLIPLPESSARLQVIHNSADAAAAEVDVYLGTDPVLTNFAFRTASPFVDVPAEVEQTITVTAPGAGIGQPVETFHVTFEANKKYIAVANGIVSATGYDPAEPFTLHVFDQAREQAHTPGNTDVLVMHGSTDAPTVDVKVGNTTLVDDLVYGAFDGYLEVPTADLVLDVTDETGNNVLVQYSAPLATLGLQDSAIAVVASGFLDPTNNSNSPNTFGLWVALPSGGSLIPLSIFTSVRGVPTAFSEVLVYPNPAVNMINYQVKDPVVVSTLRTELIDLSGRVLFSHQGHAADNATGQIDVSNLNTGIYILRITSDLLQHSERVMIRR